MTDEEATEYGFLKWLRAVHRPYDKKRLEELEKLLDKLK